jgi:hypothetical protein
MSVWDLPITNWESVTAAGDQVGKALLAAHRQFDRGWNKAHLRVLVNSLDQTKKCVVESENANPNTTKGLIGFDQSPWDDWLNVVRELVGQTFRYVFEIALTSKSDLYLRPPEFALVCSIFFAKSSLIECEGHPFSGFSVFFTGNAEAGTGRTCASLREEFKRSITDQVLDSYDDSVISLARREWNPPVSGSGIKVEESSTVIPTAPASEPPKLDELCTLVRRDVRSHKMIAFFYRALVPDIVRARHSPHSGNLSREDLKFFPIICKQKPELYPVLCQATVDEIDKYIFGIEGHINESTAAVQIIEARCGGVLKVGTIVRYTRS